MGYNFRRAFFGKNNKGVRKALGTASHYGMRAIRSALKSYGEAGATGAATARRGGRARKSSRRRKR